MCAHRREWLHKAARGAIAVRGNGDCEMVRGMVREMVRGGGEAPRPLAPLCDLDEPPRVRGRVV